MYRYISRESCSQFDSLPLTSLTIFFSTPLFSSDTSSASFLRDFLGRLPKHVVVLALPAVSTKDSTWTWRPMTPGNVEGLNPRLDAPAGAGCANPPNAESVTWSDRSAWPQFPRCPNTVEQAATWLKETNDAAARAGAVRVAGFVFDLEGGGLYRQTAAMVSAARAALATHAGGEGASVGMTGAYHMDSVSLGLDEAYPQAYWMGELLATGCTPARSAASDATCGSESIYAKTKDNPARMLATWAVKYVRAPTPSPSPAPSGARPPKRTYLLSVEQLECASHAACRCVNKAFAEKSSCGSFDGFGVWCPRPFRRFVSDLAKKYDLDSVGLFQYNEMPTAWTASVAAAPL